LIAAGDIKRIVSGAANQRVAAHAVDRVVS
jgi:hypothetical protein